MMAGWQMGGYFSRSHHCLRELYLQINEEDHRLLNDHKKTPAGPGLFLKGAVWLSDKL